MHKQTTAQAMVKPNIAPIAGGVLRRARADGRHTPGINGESEKCKRRRDEGTLQRAVVNSSSASEVPPIVHEVLNSPGQPLDKTTRAFMEPRFGYDFSGVRVHMDAKAAESAHAVNALAYTVGRDIAFDAGQYLPHTISGRRLLAHELTHVAQQELTSPNAHLTIGHTNDFSEAQARTTAHAVMNQQYIPASMKLNGANVLRRTPAPPIWQGQMGTFDRSKVQISELPNVIGSVAGDKVTLTPTTLTATVAISDPTVTHLTWELYDPSDQSVNGWSTTPGSKQATTSPLVFDGSFFNGKVTQGRYIVRCAGLRAGKPVVYADRTFYVWTSAPTSLQDQSSLTAITSSPATHSLSEVGAAYARNMMLEHQKAVAATGTGKYMGTDEGTQPTGPTASGVIREDCTTYVLEVLKHAFAAKGLSANWKAVYDEAQKTSAGAFKGTELLKALESKAGWKAVFWAPDPRNPEDTHAEHPVAYKSVKTTGKYYGIPVDNTKSVVDYRPTSRTKQENMSRLDQLRQIPLAVIAARGGDHMTLMLNGDVYEVHWDKKATDPDVIAATPLEKWEWQSGIVMMPAETFNASFTP
jgi:hypothetical protein